MSGKTPALKNGKLEAGSSFPEQQARPCHEHARLGIGRRPGHQHCWRKEGTRNGKRLILLQRDACARSEGRLSAQAFAPVAADFQHLLLLLKMPQRGD